MNEPISPEGAGASKFSVPYTLKLEHPFQWGSEQKTELLFSRRVKAKDMKGMTTGNIRTDDLMTILSRVTGEAPAVIAELDAADLFRAFEVINSFLPSGQMIGDN